MKTMTYSPDTCDCVLKLEYDETVANPTYNLVEMVKTCQAHTVLPTDTEKRDTVFDENHLKNETMTAIKDNVPELTETDKDGNIVLKRDEVSFEFEGKAPNRTIRIISKVDISSHEAAIKDQVDAATTTTVDVV
jgi:hypothetical protein